jgi:thiamine pyrophosphate-dependent acetolactate synthase large subunit-like protein
VERLILEMESLLDKRTCVVAELDSGMSALDALMTFGGDGKRYFSNTGLALGWALPAALGVKLAEPDRPVFALMGDGAFLFAGPQALWSYVRYNAGVTAMVLNNGSYNNERNRIWSEKSRQFETGRDMVCYLGDPQVSYAKQAEAFGVESEVIKEPEEIKGALTRALRANAADRPYLLDVHVERRGTGASSEWHPPFSIASLRSQNS